MLIVRNKEDIQKYVPGLFSGEASYDVLKDNITKYKAIVNRSDSKKYSLVVSEMNSNQLDNAYQAAVDILVPGEIELS